MPYDAVVLPVMIASPGDVADEREVVRNVINHWNYAHSELRRAVLMPVGWETHVGPELGSHSAQGLINVRVLSRCDLLVAVFWTRLGTPTADAASGSAEEVQRHLAAGKPALVYFSEKVVAPDMLDPLQYAELKKFKAWCLERGLVETFDTLDAFRAKFSHHLSLVMNDNPFVGELLRSSGDRTSPTQFPEALVPEALRIVRAAAAGDGQVLKISTFGGTVISAGRESFGGDMPPRELARWLHGFEQLLKLGLIEDEGGFGEVFRVTDGGYRAAEAGAGNDTGLMPAEGT